LLVLLLLLLIMEIDVILFIFERKILRKVYGPIQEGDIRRIRNNEELNRFINGENIVKFI